MIAALAVTEAVFTVAHAWSALLAAGAARGGLPSVRDVWSALEHQWPVLQATWPAIVALMLAASASSRPGPRPVGAGAVTCSLGLVLVVL